MSRYRVHLDSFSTGLEDLNRALQASDEAVLRVLHRTGRFSCFEINGPLCGTMTRLLNGGGEDRRFRFSEPLLRVTGGAYPWTEVALTDEALALIGEPVPTREPQPERPVLGAGRFPPITADPPAPKEGA